MLTVLTGSRSDSEAPTCTVMTASLVVPVQELNFMFKCISVVSLPAVLWPHCASLCVCEMIAAEGEVNASRALKEAASRLSPVAFHLRYLQSLSSVQSSSSIVVLSLPAELLHMAFSHQPEFPTSYRTWSLCWQTQMWTFCYILFLLL